MDATPVETGWVIHQPGVPRTPIQAKSLFCSCEKVHKLCQAEDQKPKGVARRQIASIAKCLS